MQVNIPSFGGQYAKSIQQAAKKLSEAGMIDFLGSDAHKIPHFKALEQMKMQTVYSRIFENNTILNNTL